MSEVFSIELIIKEECHLSLRPFGVDMQAILFPDFPRLY